MVCTLCKLDPITAVNIVLCIIIFLLGYIGYVRKQDALSFTIGIAFGLFAISHIITSFEASKPLTIAVITIRIIAYLVVIFALYRAVKLTASGQKVAR